MAGSSSYPRALKFSRGPASGYVFRVCSGCSMPRAFLWQRLQVTASVRWQSAQPRAREAGATS